MRRICVFIFILGIMIPSISFSQRYAKNFSIQLGYHGNLLDPSPINYIISRYNEVNTNASQTLQDISGMHGPYAAIGYHNGPTMVRLAATTFSSSRTGIAPLGLSDARTDLDFNALVLHFSVSRILFGFGNDSGVGVGAGLSYTNFKTASSTVSLSTFDENAALIERTNEGKFSFYLGLPISVAIIPQVKLVVEPYYQIYLSPIDFAPLHQAINPSVFDTDPTQFLANELDHFGATISAIIYLRPR